MEDKNQYIDFVRLYRQKYNITMNQLCFGICDCTNYSSFEAGKSNLSPAIEERMLERLGICTDDFYNLVDMDVYQRWLEKQEIVYKIITRELDTAEHLLEDFAQKGFVKGSFEKQYYFRMLSFISMCRGCEKTRVANYLKKCLECTLPDFSVDKMQEYAASILEIDTILDYLFYSDDKVEEHYLAVMEYINQERFNIKARMVVLAKAVHYYLVVKERKVPVKDWYQADLDNAFEWAEKAISYARVKSSSSFLYELLLWRIKLLEQKIVRDPSEKWDSMLHNTQKWEEALQYVAEYAGRDVKTIDTAHVYSSTNVESINEVIRRRKKMFHLTNEEISEGICDKKTVGRAINNQSTPQKYFAKQILNRLKYTNRLNGNCINADSIEGMVQSERFRHYINVHDYEKCEEILTKIEESFHDCNVYNNQFINGWTTYIQFRRKEISRDAYIKKMKNAVELTVPLETIYNSEQVSLSIYELMFFNHYIRKLSEEDLEEPLQMLRAITDEWLGNACELAHRTGLFLLVETVQNRLGDLGYHELSKEYSVKGIHMNLNTRQIPEMAGMFYNIWWNDNEEHKTIDKDPEGCIRQLSLCMDLAHLENRKNDYLFYKKKIKNTIELSQYCYHDQMNHSEERCEWIDLIQLQLQNQ